MRKIFAAIILLLSVAPVFAQKGDTITIKKGDLNLKSLKTGNSTYIVYNKKSKTSPARNFTLVKINTAFTTLNNQPAYSITQQWEADTVIHTASTLMDTKDASNLFHEIWWKPSGVTAKLDFVTQKAEITGTIADSIKSKIIDSFNDSFANYNLNWHNDLILLPLLPYKENRTMAINFYDPGTASKARVVYYTVAGSDMLKSSIGENIDCWLMEFAYPTRSSKAVQRYWISKKSKEVLKVEYEMPNLLVYKLKVGISGEN